MDSSRYVFGIAKLKAGCPKNHALWGIEEPGHLRVRHGVGEPPYLGEEMLVIPETQETDEFYIERIAEWVERVHQYQER